MPEFSAAVDWQRPWLASVNTAAAPVLAASDWRTALNQAAAEAGLQNHRGLALAFVAQADLPAEMAYEAFISDTGGVPTRENLHDFFNALVWLSFPTIKRTLNQLQAAEIARATAAGEVPGARGKQRDGATIFDENAVLLVSSDADFLAALREHQWQTVFMDQRAVFGESCEVILFGHALMEKLVTPYKAITGHAWPLLVERDYFCMSAAARRAWVDQAIAAAISGGFATNAFSPLPIAGVPGWWPGQDAAFYADLAVFRPKRASVPAASWRK